MFLEFTVYNPNMNLFAYIIYLFEFPSTGGVLPFTRVMTFQVRTDKMSHNVTIRLKNKSGSNIRFNELTISMNSLWTEEYGFKKATVKSF